MVDPETPIDRVICDTCLSLMDLPKFKDSCRAADERSKRTKPIERKYTPHTILMNNSLSKHLVDHPELTRLLPSLNEEDKFWGNFATYVTSSGSKKPCITLLKALCSMMLEKEKREDRGRGLQNFKVNNAIPDLVIFAIYFFLIQYLIYDCF